jgi:FKBP-type peptidyl-prolyl cis-trans isomerase (trigger factor)
MSVTMLKATKEEAVFSIEIAAEIIENAIMKEFKKVTEKGGAMPQQLPLSNRGLLEMHPEIFKLANQAIVETLPTYYMEAIEKLEIKPMTVPQINPRKFQIGEPCVVELRVVLEPEIEVKSYKGLKASYAPVVATKYDVQQQIESIRRQRGLDKNDENLLKGLPFDSIETFMTEVRSTLEEQAREKTKYNKETAVIKKLIAENPCPLPEEAVEQQVMVKINQYREQSGGQAMDNYMKSKNLTIEDIKKQVRPEVEDEVKKNLLLAAIAEQESLEVSESDIEEAIEKQQHSLMHMVLSKEDKRQQLEDIPSAMKRFKHAILLSKATDFIVSQANLKDFDTVSVADTMPQF